MDDLGLISIQLDSKNTAKVSSKNEININDNVKSLGCAEGGDCAVYPSKVTDINKFLGGNNLLVRGEQKEGRSGGSLFNQKGELIGVLIANVPYKIEDRGLFIGLDEIYKLLNKNNFQYVYNSPSTPSNKECYCQEGSCIEKEKQPPLLPKPGDELPKDCPNPLDLPLPPSNEPKPVTPNPPIGSSAGTSKWNWDDCTQKICDADKDGDGKLSKDEIDSDGDGIPDYKERILVVTPDGLSNDFADTDNDRKPDVCDKDDDGDGIPTKDELGDSDGDGIPDYLDETFQPKKKDNLKLDDLNLVPICEPKVSTPENPLPEECEQGQTQTLPPQGIPINKDCITLDDLKTKSNKDLLNQMHNKGLITDEEFEKKLKLI